MAIPSITSDVRPTHTTKSYLSEGAVPLGQLRYTAEDHIVQEHRLESRPASLEDVVVCLGRRRSRVDSTAEPAEVETLPRLRDEERRLGDARHPLTYFAKGERMKLTRMMLQREQSALLQRAAWP